jgi:conjugal transfer pilus assembly protein TraF
MKISYIALLIAAVAQSTFADDTLQQPKEAKPYFQDSERGWYWYEQLPQEEKEKFLEKLVTEQPTVIQKSESIPSQKEEKPLTTAWFLKNFENYKNAAIDNPYDKQAMRTYLYLEKFMQDKAIAFGYERQKIVYSDPFLDSTSKRPTANMGLRTMNREASEYRDSLIAEVGSKSGIFFFYRSDCSFCEQQAPLVKALEKEYGFSIRPVSLDGLALKEPLWDDFIVNDNQAETLGVYQVPATYIFNPETNTIELIAQGLQSLPQLKDRIIAASERAGLISTDQANLTHGSGLYQSLDGQYSAGVPFPDDAPEEFKTLYSQFVSQEKSQ